MQYDTGDVDLDDQQALYDTSRAAPKNFLRLLIITYAPPVRHQAPCPILGLREGASSHPHVARCRFGRICSGRTPESQISTQCRPASSANLTFGGTPTADSAESAVSDIDRRPRGDMMHPPTGRVLGWKLDGELEASVKE